MPPFHLIGVAKEDWSPFSLRINSLYSTSFVKYGFSVKPLNKTIYEKLGLLMVLGRRWNTGVIFASSLLWSFSLFVCFQHFVPYNVFFEKVYMYHGIHTFLMQSMWSFFIREICWFKKLSIDSKSDIILSFAVTLLFQISLQHQVFCHILWVYVFNLQS